MRRFRAWMVPVALVAWTVAACDVKVAPPPTPSASTGVIRKTPAPVKTPPTTAPISLKPGESPAGSPSPGASVAPSTAPSAGASAAPSAAPSSGFVAPSAGPVAGGDGDLMWIDGLEPLIQAPDGTVPKIVMWAKLAPEIGVAAYHQVTRSTSNTGAVTISRTVTYDPDPADVDVTIISPPGSPGTTLTAYEISYEYTTPNQQAAGKPPIVLGPTTVPMAPVIIPPAGDAKAGTPVTIPVPIGAKALADVFAGGANDVPGLVIATIEFKDGDQVPVPDRDLNPLKVTVPVRMMQGAKPAGAAPPPPVAPAPPVLPAVAAGPDGAVPKVVGPAGIAPADGIAATVTQDRRTDASGNVFVETSLAYAPASGEATIWLTAPPNGKGTILSAYELTYEYTTATMQQAGKPPIVVGPVLVPLPPKPVHAGRVTAVRVPVTSSLVDRILTSGSGADAPKLVTAHVEFKDDGGVPVPDKDLNPLKVSIPITVK